MTPANVARARALVEQALRGSGLAGLLTALPPHQTRDLYLACAAALCAAVRAKGEADALLMRKHISPPCGEQGERLLKEHAADVPEVPR